MHELNDSSIHFAPQFFLTPGDHAVSQMQERLHYSQAVRWSSRVPHDRIEISGQGGWDADVSFPDDLGDEIARAFDNVETILREAGATWEHVVAIDSFHVASSDASIGDDHTAPMAAQLWARMPSHRPIWTQLGVHTLGAPRMRVEIRVTAIVPAADAAAVATAR